MASQPSLGGRKTAPIQTPVVPTAASLRPAPVAPPPTTSVRPVSPAPSPPPTLAVPSSAATPSALGVGSTTLNGPPAAPSAGPGVGAPGAPASAAGVTPGV